MKKINQKKNQRKLELNKKIKSKEKEQKCFLEKK
jgi:hypothetical protein